MLKGRRKPSAFPALFLPARQIFRKRMEKDFMRDLNEIYAALPERLLPWYRENARNLPWRESREPYRVWVSEIMLQQTRVEAVRGYYERWMQAFPDVRALAAADEAQVLKLWEGLGYYSRARNLHRAAQLVCERYGGTLPADYEALLALPGVGEYTAGAVASIGFGLCVPAVDGNVMRVAARLNDDFTPITDAKQKKRTTGHFSEITPEDRPGDFNQSLMELGAMVCLPNGAPRCGSCPVQHLCLGYHHGHAEILPVRAAKRARRIEERTVLLVRCGEEVGICRRPKTGLLAGLWELPSLEGKTGADELRARLSARGWQVEKLLSLRGAKHVFTHVEWHMSGFEVTLAEKPEGLTFVTPQALRESYALPSAFRAFLSVLEE